VGELGGKRGASGAKEEHDFLGVGGTSSRATNVCHQKTPRQHMLPPELFECAKDRDKGGIGV